MPEQQRDERYWRERAEDAKSRAATLATYELREELLLLAERYERLANRTAARSRHILESNG